MSSDRSVPHFYGTLSPTERGFIAALIAKRPNVRVLRNGWPDFLFERNGQFYGVEVKSEHDVMRPAQVTMFAALERAGLKVYVWSPLVADRLVHWRRFYRNRPRAQRRKVGVVAKQKPLSRGSFGRV